MSKQIEEVMTLVEDQMEDANGGILSTEQYVKLDLIRTKLRELLPVWQPIETAPKEVCTEFDGWNGERVTNVSWGWPDYHPKEKRCWIRAVYETGHGWINEEVHGLTHWIPIQKAPE